MLMQVEEREGEGRKIEEGEGRGEVKLERSKGWTIQWEVTLNREVSLQIFLVTLSKYIRKYL